MSVNQAQRPISSAQPNAPWWRGAVIYQIYPRSFRDTNGNGIGDLKGIVEGLDHIASLGVDAVWISPFFTSPMRDFGYDVSDYCGIDPSFGTFEDFDRIIEKAHGLGLKIIIDQVYSHTSDEHPWFIESASSRTNPKADWYVWADPKPDGSPPSNWQSVFGGSSWQWHGARKQYYLHNFLVSQPDLNVHNRDVQDALLDVARFWLGRGVDGFRLDALNFSMHDPEFQDNPPSGRDMARVTRPFDMQLHTKSQSHPDIPAFLERIRSVFDEYPSRFTVAEVGGPHPLGEMKAFTQGERRLNSAYNFDFLYAEELDADLIRKCLEQWPAEDGEGWPSWAFSNHDAPRAVSRWARGRDREDVCRLLLLLLTSLRGNAFIYQGEELGLPQGDVAFEDLQDPEAIANWPHTLGRDGARTPMPWKKDAPFAGFSDGGMWLKVDPAHAALAVDSQDADNASMLNYTRALLSLRKQLPALITGSLELIDAPDGVVAFTRRTEEMTVLCAYNLGANPVSWRPDNSAAPRMVATPKSTNCDEVLPMTIAPWSGYWAICEDSA